jgi:hypothetical protein
VHPPVRRGLRHRPPVHAALRRDGDALGGAPEVLRRVVVEPVGLGVHRAGELHIVRGQPESGDLREEADVDVGLVRAGLEQEGVPGLAELGRLLLLEDRVDLLLDLLRGGVRAEDVHVRAEVRLGGGQSERGRGPRRGGDDGTAEPGGGERRQHGAPPEDAAGPVGSVAFVLVCGGHGSNSSTVSGC